MADESLAARQLRLHIAVQHLGTSCDWQAHANCIVAIGMLVDDLAPYLRTWDDDTSTAAVENLAVFIDNCFRSLLQQRQLDDVFWRDRQAQMQTVVDWLLRPETSQRLETAFFQNLDNPQRSARISTAIQQLQWIHCGPNNPR